MSLFFLGLLENTILLRVRRAQQTKEAFSSFSAHSGSTSLILLTKKKSSGNKNDFIHFLTLVL